MKTIIVTGTSSGIGNQICIQAAAMNFRVISVSRNIETLKDLDGIESFKLDITDKDLSQFIEQMTTGQFEKVMEFFNGMPKLRHVIKVTNPNTKKKNEGVVEGLQSFLGQDFLMITY